MQKLSFHREPFRGGQFCGHQMSYGVYGGEYCSDRKAEGLFACERHDRELREEYGTVRWASGNAEGDSAESLVLLWESFTEERPEEPTAEEIQRYAPLLNC